MKPFLSCAAALATLAACSQSPTSPLPGDSEDHAPWSGITAGETIHFTGTEPFWGGEASGSQLRYSTPEDQRGTTIAVERFAGRNGLSLSGELDGQPFVLAVSPGQCSDGMSDRTYPFDATLKVGGEQRNGCAWTDRTSFTGPQNP